MTTFTGENIRGRITVPQHAHPLVREYVLELNARRATFGEVAEVTNVDANTQRFWLTKHLPRIDLFDAALNAVGLRLFIGKRNEGGSDVKEAIAHLEPEVLPLNRRQRDCYDALVKLSRQFGRAPTREELRIEMGFAHRSGVIPHLHALKAAGLVTWHAHEGCTLRVVDRSADRVTLPPDVVARLLDYCAAAGQLPSDFVADAVTLHLDELGPRFDVPPDLGGGTPLSVSSDAAGTTADELQRASADGAR